MTEMKRLLDEPGSQAALLLGSAASDGPTSPEEAQARALTTAEKALPTVAGGQAGSRQGGAFGNVWRVGSWGLLAAVTIFAGVVTVRSSSTPAQVAAAPTETVASPKVASPVSAPASHEGIRVEELPTAVQPPAEVAAPEAPREKRPSLPPESSRLEDELAAIDAARSSIAARHPDVALARVHAYQAKFRDGRFAEEADALEIQALAALGRRAEARVKAERFLAVRPGSPYEHRVLPSAAPAEVEP